MKHNRMINPLNETPDKGKPDNSGPPITRECSEQASEIAQELILTFAGAMEDKELSPFEVMQSLVEFFVSTVKVVESTQKVPADFRKFLMRNVELNFDYKDAKEQGIDLSDLLIMGLREEMEGEGGDT